MAKKYNTSRASWLERERNPFTPQDTDPFTAERQADLMDKARIALKSTSPGHFIEDLEEQAWNLVVLYLSIPNKRVRSEYSYMYGLALRGERYYTEPPEETLPDNSPSSPWLSHPIYSCFSTTQIKTPVGMLYALSCDTPEEAKMCSKKLSQWIGQRTYWASPSILDPTQSSLPFEAWVTDRLRKVGLPPREYYDIWEYGISSEQDLADFGIYHSPRWLEHVEP